MITACIKTQNGQTRIVNSGSDCNPSEQVIQWNVTGPPGQVGPPGPAGQNGAVGMDGADGRDGLDGMDGADGADGVNGISCWDTNANRIPDPSEDVNGDTQFDGLDCQGDPGPPGPAGQNGADGMDGADGQDGLDGMNGMDGADGADGADGVNGISCWDTNANRIPDPSEDVNGDTQFDGLDCQGDPGPPGPAGQNGADGMDGADGVDGISCWDTNGNRIAEPNEDKNSDGVYDGRDCQGSFPVVAPAGLEPVSVQGNVHQEIVEANCPTGKVVVGGSVKVIYIGLDPDVNWQRNTMLRGSYPLDDGVGWHAEAQLDSDLVLEVQAHCVPAELVPRYEIREGGAIAVCREEAPLLLGGGGSNNPLLSSMPTETIGSSNTLQKAWYVEGGTAWAICAEALLLSPNMRNTTIDLVVETASTSDVSAQNVTPILVADAQCARGGMPLSGGFDIELSSGQFPGTGTTLNLFESRQTLPGDGWIVNIRREGQNIHSIQSYVICTVQPR